MGGVRSWWDGLAARERVLLGVLGALVAGLILVFALILPVIDARDDAANALRAAKTEQALLARAAPSGNAARQPFTRSALLQSARSQGIQISRIQPGSAGEFSVWIDDAPTEALYALFEDLLGSTTAKLDRAVLSSDANGRLSAQFTVGG